MPRHRELTGPSAAHPPGIISDVDPGDVGAGKLWIDTSSGTPPWAFWLRNETNDAWEATGGSAGALSAALAALSSLTPAADMAPYYTGTTTAALTGLSAFMRTVLDDVDAASARTTLGLGIGTAVQAYDAELQAIAGLASAADKLPYFSGAGAAALATFTAAGRALVDDADSTAQRATLGLGTLAVLNSVAQANVSGLTTADSPQFAGLNVGHATNTTITQSAPGQIAVEGVNVSMAGHSHAGVAAQSTVLSGSGNYNLPAGAVFLRTLMVGGGGGGGGSTATAVGESACAGGGGGGGWAEAYLDASTLDAVIAYVVGGGGSGGSSGVDGGSGSDSTFGAAGKAYRMIAKAGSGGSSSLNTTGSARNAGGVGGVAGTVPSGGASGVGGDGSMGIVVNAANICSGDGGGSRLGGVTRANSSANGSAGGIYGGGGSGGTANPSSAARTGGTGAAGVIIVTAFFGS